jgi:hypothetical protein
MALRVPENKARRTPGRVLLAFAIAFGILLILRRRAQPEREASVTISYPTAEADGAFLPPVLAVKGSVFEGILLDAPQAQKFVIATDSSEILPAHEMVKVGYEATERLFFLYGHENSPKTGKRYVLLSPGKFVEITSQAP